MLYPKKVKFRKFFTMRQHPDKVRNATRGTLLSFGSVGLKAITGGRITSNEIEAARKTISRSVSKTGRMWIRIFPDRPFTRKPAEVKMGKGKGEPEGFVAVINPGRVLFEVDGIDTEEAISSLIKAGSKLSVKTKIINRQAI
jgi:large subunit ribosomal protein L16